jgi:signal transduction histidine kinase
VLAELRDVATELRPSSLAQLGLVPALEAIDGLTVTTDGDPDPLPEPLRTGVYRLVEQVVSRATGDVTVHVRRGDDELAVTIDAELPDLAAARARVALLGGTLGTDGRPDGRTRLRARFPIRHALRV